MDSTKKGKVLEFLCELVSETSVKLFGESEAHDCFCGQNEFSIGGFQMNQKVLDFIRASVEEKLKNRYVSTLEQSSIDSEEESKIVILFTANGIREGHSENICHNCAGADKDCPDCGGNGFY